MSNLELAFLQDLEELIRCRFSDLPDGSYTAELARSGTKRIAQKVGEEGVELALAAAIGQKEDTIDEAADLLYHVIVLLVDQDLSLADVCERLRARHSS